MAGVHDGMREGKKVAAGEDEDGVEGRRRWPVAAVQEGGGGARQGGSRWRESVVRRR